MVFHKAIGVSLSTGNCVELGSSLLSVRSTSCCRLELDAGKVYTYVRFCFVALVVAAAPSSSWLSSSLADTSASLYRCWTLLSLGDWLLSSPVTSSLSSSPLTYGLGDVFSFGLVLLPELLLEDDILLLDALLEPLLLCTRCPFGGALRFRTGTMV